MPAFNLPSRFALRTVGPIIRGELTAAARDLSAGCCRSCLETADADGLESLAFCCILLEAFYFLRRAMSVIALVDDWNANRNKLVREIQT